MDTSDKWVISAIAIVGIVGLIVVGILGASYSAVHVGKYCLTDSEGHADQTHCFYVGESSK